MPEKQLLAAGIVRDICFRNKDAFNLYLYKLKHDKKTYEILDTFLRKDGSIIVRIVRPYNHAEMIRLL